MGIKQNKFVIRPSTSISEPSKILIYRNRTIFGLKFIQKEGGSFSTELYEITRRSHLKPTYIDYYSCVIVPLNTTKPVLTVFHGDHSGPQRHHNLNPDVRPTQHRLPYLGFVFGGVIPFVGARTQA